MMLTFQLITKKLAQYYSSISTNKLHNYTMFSSNSELNNTQLWSMSVGIQQQSSVYNQRELGNKWKV